MSLALVLALRQRRPAQPVRLPPAQQVFPEGISLRPGSDTFYVSSTANGAIYRGTLDKPRLKVFLPPGANGRALATGVRASRDHLIVNGSVTGYIFVYDVPSGRFVRRFATGSGGLINDVAIAPNGDVYSTDSNRGLVFRIPAKALSKRTSATKRLNPFVRVKDTPIGSFANGIVSAGDRYLLVVGLATGVVGRIDLQTKRVREVTGFSPAGRRRARPQRTHALRGELRQPHRAGNAVARLAARDGRAPDHEPALPPGDDRADRRQPPARRELSVRQARRHADAAVHGGGGSSPWFLVRLSQSPSCWPTSATDEPADWIAPPIRSA